MTTATPTADTAVPIAPVMRNVYLARAGFAVVWAALLVLTASSLDSIGTLSAVTAVLLVLYPVVDAAAAWADLRTVGTSRSFPALHATVAISLLAAGGLAVALGSDLAAVLRVWGAWAIAAGLVQLVVAVGRRGAGGQWAQVLSGGISVLAGGSFLAQAGSDAASLGSLAGYATLGGIFFLLSAVRLHRSATVTR